MGDLTGLVARRLGLGILTLLVVSILIFFAVGFLVLMTTPYPAHKPGSAMK